MGALKSTDTLSEHAKRSFHVSFSTLQQFVVKIVSQSFIKRDFVLILKSYMLKVVSHRIVNTLNAVLSLLTLPFHSINITLGCRKIQKKKNNNFMHVAFYPNLTGFLSASFSFCLFLCNSANLHTIKHTDLKCILFITSLVEVLNIL